MLQVLPATIMNGVEINPTTLDSKMRWTDMQQQAINEDFIGIRTSEGLEKGLFTIKPTGISTQSVLNAANDFLDGLTNLQLLNTLFHVQDTEWRKWGNVTSSSFVRQGISLEEMRAEQYADAMELLRQSLSSRGFQLVQNIRKTEGTLYEITPFKGFNEDFYYITMMGIPSESEPWGWQMDGHHLVINYFLLGDQVVMSPVLLGCEPAVTTTGKYAGNSILQHEQDRGLALINALSPDLQEAAILTREKPGSINQAQAFKDNLVLDYEGARVSDFNPYEKQQLVELIELFVGNLREGHAGIRMEEVKANLDETWFAWVGDTKDDSVFYFRIHSPVILIEFDHQPPAGTRTLYPDRKPIRDHIHVMIRTPNGNDYGKDLLRQHYLEHPH